MSSTDLDRVFTHEELYLSSPRSFNDPFDCSTRLDTTNIKVIDKKEYCKIIAKLIDPESSVSDLKKLADDLFKTHQHNDEFFSEQFHLIAGATFNINNNYGILSLSKIKNDILMWSHYADDHKGIVLEFDKSLIKGTINGLVKYEKTFPSVRDFIEAYYKKKLFRIFLLRKSRHWKYESEYRIIKEIDIKTNFRVANFQPACLTGVILGHKTSVKDSERLIMWCKYRNSKHSSLDKLKLFQAKINKKTYSIGIEPVAY